MGDPRRFLATTVISLGLLVPAIPTLAAPGSAGRLSKPGVHVAARSAGSASRSSVSTTARNSRRYRKQKDDRIKDDERTIRNLSKKDRRRSRYGAPRQAGGYCMYDTQGNVILRPDGVVCEDQQGEYMRSSGGSANSTPPSAARSTCVKGDCKNGEGVYVWSNGTQYLGHFKNGRQHGAGLLIMPSGSRYDGEWRSGKKHGLGVATYQDGRVQTGEWEENRFLGSRQARRVRIRWPDLTKAPPKVIGGGERDAAVIVGVTRYAHVADVPGAVQNATDWYSYLIKTRGVPLDKVTLLLDEDATVEEMRYAAKEAARQVKKKGTLWFVFVGHGAPARDGSDGLLVGFDAQQKARSIESRSLRRSALLEALEASKARNVQVLLDACFSGKTPSGAQLVAGLQPLVVQAGATPTDRRTTLLTAAGSNEYAGPLPGANRPAFSYLVLGGLRGWADNDDDGRITSGELHGYVSQTMRALVRDRRQRPTLVGDEDRRLVKSGRETGPDIARFVVDSARR